MQVNVPDDLFNEAEKLYAPPDHPCFELVPPAFERKIVAVYAAMNTPEVTFDSFWEIYRELLRRLRALPYEAEFAAVLSAQSVVDPVQRISDPIDILPYAEIGPGACVAPISNEISLTGSNDLYQYIGGVAAPSLPRQLRNYAPVDDDEDSDDFTDVDEIELTESEGSEDEEATVASMI